MYRLETLQRPAEETALGDEFHRDVFGLQQHRRGGGHRLLQAAGRGVQQFAGVGVLGIIKDVGDGALLDDFPQLHDADPVAVVVGQAQVVGDEDDGHVVGLL